MQVGAVGNGSNASHMIWLKQLKQMATQKKAGKAGILTTGKDAGLDKLLTMRSPNAGTAADPLQGQSAVQPTQGPQAIDFSQLAMQISVLAREESFDLSILQVEGMKMMVGPGSIEVQKYNFIQISGSSQLNEVQGVLSVERVGALVDGYA